jgi:hypothetical protein
MQARNRRLGAGLQEDLRHRVHMRHNVERFQRWKTVSFILVI